MSGGALRRWWRTLFPAGDGAPAPPAPPPRPAGGAGPDEPRPAPHRRHYRAAPVADDPQRESRLGAVLQAVAAGPLPRAELARRVDADDWGPGRFDAVVDHGVDSHVLVETDAGVAARYAD